MMRDIIYRRVLKEGTGYWIHAKYVRHTAEGDTVHVQTDSGRDLYTSEKDLAISLDDLSEHISGAPLELYKQIRAILIRCNRFTDDPITYAEAVNNISGLMVEILQAMNYSRDSK